jgi:shikimate 5-dehydrogenase
MHTIRLDEIDEWAGAPLVVFVGVRTGGSLAHAVFGRWAAALDQPWVLRGLDLPIGTPPQTYRRLLSAVRGNAAVAGAVVTAHKLRLYRACAADITVGDELVEVTREVNTLSARDGQVRGYARDAAALSHVLPPGADVLCLGAGGAGTALLLAARERGTASATFADTSAQALDDLRAVAGRAGVAGVRLSYVPVNGPEDCDALVAGPPVPQLVVNATGLGKDAPGSPVTDRAPFGPSTLAWDFNYRGGLDFLRQAAAKGAPTVDGWDYFVAGWTGCLTTIAGIPFTEGVLADFAEAAAPYRPRDEASPDTGFVGGRWQGGRHG